MSATGTATALTLVAAEDPPDGGSARDFIVTDDGCPTGRATTALTGAVWGRSTRPPSSSTSAAPRRPRNCWKRRAPGGPAGRRDCRL